MWKKYDQHHDLILCGGSRFPLFYKSQVLTIFELFANV